jgi:eukaryotic-like serine/threonine-protein kinase
MRQAINIAPPVKQLPDSILGYTIQARIGCSVSADLYRGCNADGQCVAIKHATCRDARSLRTLALFQNELDFARRVHHPDVRRVYSLDLAHNVYGDPTEAALIMEYVDGSPIRRSPGLSIAQTIAWFAEVAYALAAMHRSQIIHCDVKPGNILVTDDNRIKLIDLGQCCTVGSHKAQASGTPDFMAPEQSRHVPLSPKADIYGFGATLYWLLTGELVPAIAPEDALPHGSPATPPMRINHRVPRVVSDLVMACIQPDHRFRPESLAQLAPRLELIGMATNRDQSALAAAG